MEEIKYLSYLKNKLNKYRIIIMGSFICGLLSYTFAFTNKLLNHDEVHALFGKGATIDSGRWGLEIMSTIFPDFSTPWIYGVTSIAIICIAICVIVELLNIRNKVLQFVFSIAVVAFPSLTGTVAYMFTLCSYSVAFLASVLAVGFARRNEIKHKLIGILLSVFSLSIYQPYFAITSSLLLVCMFYDTLQHDFELKREIKKGLYYLLHIIIAGMLYLAITYAVLFFSGVEFNEYASDSLTSNEYLTQIKRAYTMLVEETLYGSFGFMGDRFCRIMTVVAFAAAACKWVVIRQKNIDNLLLSMVILLLLPLSVCSMEALFGETHTLLFYSFISLYSLACIIFDCESTEQKWSKNVLTEIFVVAMLLSVVSNIYSANRAYLREYLSNETAKAYFTSMLTRVESMPEYTEGTKIAIIGDSNNIYDFPQFDSVPSIMGTSGYLVNAYSREEFISYYLGYSGKFANEEECKMISETEEFKEMSEYPYYDSIRDINGIVVVKFGDIK